MAWFPIAFLLSFDVKLLSEDFALRTMFLLAASSVDIQKWQERDLMLLPRKRTVLESYEYASNRIPIIIAKGDDKYVELSLQGLSNTLNSN